MKKRNICDVIERLERIIPENDPVQVQLKKLRHDSAYVAPEIAVDDWWKLCEIMNARVIGGGDEKPEWFEQSLAIVNGTDGSLNVTESV